MYRQAITHLAGYKHWADRGLLDVAGQALGSLPKDEAVIVLRVLDHIHAVDRIFQGNLLGEAQGLSAPHSQELPAFETLADNMHGLDDWFVSYVDGLSERELAEQVDFAFTSGRQVRMTRGDMLLHVCLHGTYHRGNAGILLQKNGIAPNEDRVTDFLESAGYVTAP